MFRRLIPLLVLLSAPSHAAQIGPTPTIIADGVTPVTLLVVADDPQETIAVAIEGRVSAIQPVAGGYVVTWLPPEATDSRIIAFIVTVIKGEDTSTISRDIHVVPPTVGRIDLTPKMPTVSSGSHVDVTLAYQGTSPFSAQQRRPLVTASIGVISEPTFETDGHWHSLYTPPSDLDSPDIAVITAIDTTATNTIFGVLPIAVTVTEVLTFETLPDAPTTVTVGADVFGPIIASPAGTVSIPIETHPAEPTATMSAVHPDGRKKKQKVALGFTVSPAIGLAPLPTHAPTDSLITTRAWCFNPDSSPCDTKKIIWYSGEGYVLTRSAGRKVPAEVTATVGPKRLTIQAQLGNRTVKDDLVAVSPPLDISIKLDPPALTAGVRTFSAVASLRKPSGIAPTGVTTRLTTSQATVTKRARRAQSETTVSYRKFRSSVEAMVRAHPIGAATGLPPTTMTGWAGRGYRFTEGSAAEIPLFFGITDALDIGVPNITVSLSLSGPAMLSKGTATSNAQGLIVVPLTATGNTGLVVVEATADGLSASAALWMGAADAPVPQLVATGTPQDQALSVLWQRRAPTVVIGNAAVVAQIEVPKEIALPPTPEELLAAQADAALPTDDAVPTETPKESRWVTQETRRLRVRALGMAGQGNVLQSPDEAAQAIAATLDTDASVLGFHGGVDLWFSGGRWALETEFRATRLQTTLGDAITVVMPIEVWTGLRYQRPVSGPLSLGGGLDLYTGSGTVTSGSEEDPTPVSVPMMGGRLSAGARLNMGDTYVRLRATQTLVPYPVLTTAELLLDIGIPSSSIDLSLAVIKELRSATYSVGKGLVGTKRDSTLVTVGVVVPFL